MSVYLDASVLVSLFTDDAFSERANAAFKTSRPDLVVSNFAATEFSSVIARLVRMGRLSPETAQNIFSDFDLWTANWASGVAIESVDIAGAGRILRRLDLNLRAPDAIHIAACQRIGVELATFDDKMAAAARALQAKLAAL